MTAMNKNRFLKLTRNREFIHGIFNYCDRWCERCGFTRRCSVYAVERDASHEKEEWDITNEMLREQLHNAFQFTIELLRDAAHEQGIDLDAAVSGEEERIREAERLNDCQNSLVRGVREYSAEVNRWFANHEEHFQKIGRRLSNEEDLGIGKPLMAASMIVDAIEGIRWYQMQIWVKLLRALDEEEVDIDSKDLEDGQEFSKDSDCSAKVALIGMDRSIGAWSTLQNHFDPADDSITRILVSLIQLRSEVEMHFPHARRFVRPGFDQEV